jgi:flagellar basal body-associated protein FliL
MAKDEKKKEDGDKKEAKPETPPDEAAASSKKKKLLIFGIGGAVALAGIGGGITFMLAGGKGGEHAAKAPEGAPPDAGHGGEKKAEAPAETKKEGAEHKKEGAEPKKEEAHGEKKAEGEGEKKPAAKKGDVDDKNKKIEGLDFGCTHNFPMFNLNLGNPLENRFMRMEVAVEFGCGEEAKAELERRAPQLRDAINAVARRKTREFMLGPDGLDQLRKEIHTKLNGILTNKVDKVFITDLLIE